MAWDLTAWAAGESGSATHLNNRVKNNLSLIGVTQTYTPAIGGTGWAKGNGTLTGYYTSYGNRVQVVIKFVLGTTSSGGTGGLTFTAPAGPVATTTSPGVMILGKGGTNFVGVAQLVSSAFNVYYVNSAAGALAAVVNGQPSAGNWATGDTIYLSADYFI